jgi:transcriptional regulator with XRE-family HTH domain
MTQKKFAEKMGVSMNTASYWENGRTQPMPEKISKIALELGTTEEFLRTGAQINETKEPKIGLPEDVTAFVEEARQKIASAKGVAPSQVRISIDL